MRRIVGLGVAGLLVGLAGPAWTHDMAGGNAGAHFLTAAPGEAAARAAPHAVAIANFAFRPAQLTVAPGTTVTWTNDDEDVHVVVSADDPQVFKSAPLDTGDRFSFTFAKPGTYRYFCAIHPHMTGTVIVAAR